MSSFVSLSFFDRPRRPPPLPTRASCFFFSGFESVTQKRHYLIGRIKKMNNKTTTPMARTQGNETKKVREKKKENEKKN